MKIQVKRVYEAPEPSDGYRVLVDRIWPRGVAKKDLKFDLWLKDIAPSTELRRWFAHDPKRWTAFRTRYFAELGHKGTQLNELVETQPEVLTLLYSARDEQHNQAVALCAYLRKMQKP